MAGQWLNLGGDDWYLSAEDYAAGNYNWRSTPDPTTALQYSRFGNEALLLAARGKTVRGWRIKHRHHSGPTENQTRMVGLFLGVGAFPQPDYTFPASVSGGFVERTSTQADTTRPIGRFSTNVDDYDRDSVNWPGVFSYGASRQIRSEAGGGTPVRFDLTQFEVFVDDTPTWTLSGNTTVVVGNTTRLDVKLSWPDGSPVITERIIMVASFGTKVRPVPENPFDDTWYDWASVDTDIHGMAAFLVSGRVESVGTLRVYLYEINRADLYSPRLEKDFQVIVSAAVSPEPPEPICIDYPEQAYVPGVAAHMLTTPVFAWDSGANSIAITEGDAELKFSGMELVVAAALGLAPAPGEDAPPDVRYERITHGFMFTSSGNQRFAQIVESGQLRGARFEYDTTTEFKVQRAGPTVAYLVNDTRLYLSRVESFGPLVAASSLYATGDQVP